MKTKMLIVILSIVTVLCSCMGISACGNSDNTPDDHTHTYNTDNVCTECSYKLEYTEGLAYILYGEEYVFLGGGTNSATNITVAAYYNSLPVTYVILYEDVYLEAIVASGVITESELEIYYSNKITSITIPDGITYVGIRGYDSIKSASIPNTVLSLVVEDCDNIKEINVPSTVTSLYIYDCPLLETETVNGLTYYQNCLLYWDENLTKIEMRDGTTTISQSILGNTSKVVEVIIPDSMTVISAYAFRDCAYLESITISENVTYIGDYVFDGCTSLKSIMIPDSVTAIGDWAFNSCTSLTDIVIGSGVVSIGIAAFYNCPVLTTIYFNGTAEQWNTVSVSAYDNLLFSAITICYYAENNSVTDKGNYWYYDDNGSIVIWTVE